MLWEERIPGIGYENRAWRRSGARELCPIALNGTKSRSNGMQN